jgi:hypothetical protein
MVDTHLDHMETEVVPFLLPSARTDLRTVAVQYFLGLTGGQDGRRFIAEHSRYLKLIVDVIDDEQLAIAKDAYLSIVNLATEPDVAKLILDLPIAQHLLHQLLASALDTGRVDRGIACMALSNLSRPESNATMIADFMANDPDLSIYQVIDVFCKDDSHTVDYLAPFLSNLTQVHSVRTLLMSKDRCVLQRLLPYIGFEKSLTRRGGIVGAIRNCCFQTEFHQWLLSNQVDILPRLLLPLAGPEEFDDDDMEKLPEDLQYLNAGKQREADADIRRMLVEAINQLCALQPCRQYIKDKNAYVILRELHNWEQDDANLVAIEKLISVLISDEPERGMENLNELDIPEHVVAKLKKADEEECKA